MRPVFASSATTSFGRWVRYMIPLSTIGEASHDPATCAWNSHCISRFLTLVGSIWRSWL
jgi:hypothetical protein